MTIKAEWLDQFMELLWEHHSCDWEYGNKFPDYPLQLAVAYFDWDYNHVGKDGYCNTPARTVEEAFRDYVESENEQVI